MVFHFSVQRIFVLFAWYHQISSSERFIGILNPIVFVLLAGAAVRGWDVLQPRLGSRAPFWGKTALALLSGTLLASFGVKAATWGLAHPFETDRPLACYRDVFDRVDGASGVIYGHSGDLSFYQFEKPRQSTSIPKGPAPDDLSVWLNERGKMFVVDWEMAGTSFLSRHFDSVTDHSVRLVNPIKGWTVSYADPHHTHPHVLVLTR